MTREEYIQSLAQTDPILESVEATLKKAGLPPMFVNPDLGRLLTVLVASTRAQHVLEIGTFGGYSAICLARGLTATGRLISLEQKPEHAEIAKHHIADAGLSEQIEIIVGEAVDSLDTLHTAGHQFDVIFIDADKPNYPNYLQRALALAKPGTLIVADNVLLRDKVLDMTNDNPSPRAVRSFNQTFMNHPLLISTILPVHDGFAVACVREYADAT
ncbi:O-methyltransferase [Alicyclobacillus fodiniaquatilis]|jgi:predicted O-methyltransferase YrrM|uniref:O-methyltransferase n=1 Tax=Alicyclobacillus fodiniaquatilis TaxID=1661150 RepID=A0ABW4JHF9_9BACL